MASYHMTNLLPPPQSIPNIEIVFDSNGIYFAGKIVSGRVICTFYNDPICLSKSFQFFSLQFVYMDMFILDFQMSELSVWVLVESPRDQEMNARVPL